MAISLAEEIILAILAAALAAFIILGIVIAVYLIKLLRRIHRVSAKAENVVIAAQKVGEAVQDSIDQFSLAHLVRTAMKSAQKRSKKRNKAKD
jgi:hypothetical protein